MYKGPWKVLANKRTPKDPSAPKRPMSAFLAFSNKRRAGLKREHPEATNADLSKMLSKTWREAPDELRKKYTDEEAELRSHYKVEMAKWRKKVADERKQERTEREDLAMLAAEARANEPPSSSKVAPSRMGAAGLGGGGGAGQFGGGGMGHVSANPNLSNLRGQMQSEMNSGLPGSAGQMYGNPYGMSNVGGLGSFGLPGGGGSADPSHYANLMAGGNPFGGSQFSMGANNSSQHQLLLNQLLGTFFW